MSKAKSFIVAILQRFWQYLVTCRFFCGHLQWMKTGNTLGSKLHEHKCLNCGKSIYRDSFNQPVSFKSQAEANLEGRINN